MGVSRITSPSHFPETYGLNPWKPLHPMQSRTTAFTLCVTPLGSRSCSLCWPLLEPPEKPWDRTAWPSHFQIFYATRYWSNVLGRNKELINKSHFWNKLNITQVHHLSLGIAGRPTGYWGWKVFSSTCSEILYDGPSYKILLTPAFYSIKIKSLNTHSIPGCGGIPVLKHIISSL